MKDLSVEQLRLLKAVLREVNDPAHARTADDMWWEVVKALKQKEQGS